MEQLRDTKGVFSESKNVQKKSTKCANLKPKQEDFLPPTLAVFSDFDLCDFDSSKPVAGSTFSDNSYLDSCSFYDINKDLFAGQLKPLKFCIL